MNTESIVKARYAAGSRKKQEALCCAVAYDARYLEVIPSEVVERDYGCGDPSRHVRRGEVVLDLGSGTGKGCFIASQIVGPRGRVIGVDMTEEMLEVARRNAPLVAERIGYANVEFRRGRIQDLALDLDWLDSELNRLPVSSVDDFERVEESIRHRRLSNPMVPDGSVDLVVSNCVLNLVEWTARPALFSEIHRVLKPGGRAVISDIVSSETVPEGMQSDPGLWSGCISGAFREDHFLKAFSDAGFGAMRLAARDATPWRVECGIEFRSLTVEAFKRLSGPCLERDRAVIYRGPFREVIDDDGNRFERGMATPVCQRAVEFFRRLACAGDFELVERTGGRDESPVEKCDDSESGGCCCG